MLSTTKELAGYALQGLDGDIGKTREFYFDDRHWTVRYLVADTGNWLTGRQVLISPYALLRIDRDSKCISIDLTKQQIADSPSMESDKPLSQQFEVAFYSHYGYPMYWGGPHRWGASPYPVKNPSQWIKAPPGEQQWDSHLRSTRTVRGHHIEASNGSVGHVEDFILDDETWTIRYLVIDTRNWLPGKRVLVSPQWIDRVSWSASTVFVNLSRETIEHAPEYREDSLLTREVESGLHRHYNREGYWVAEPEAKEIPR